MCYPSNTNKDGLSCNKYKVKKDMIDTLNYSKYSERFGVNE